MQRIIALMLEVEEEAVLLNEAAGINAGNLLEFTRRRLEEIDAGLNCEFQEESKRIRDMFLDRNARRLRRIAEEGSATSSPDGHELDRIAESLMKEILT
ncbi:MAG: hypothetical protein PHQ23_12555 [Candidatus Wallbacteria bacterium]|nr:hypothetical protein [Candidatus Wallbacteria bacterium]